MSAGSATVEGRREFRLFVGVQAGASNRRRIYLGIHKKYIKKERFFYRNIFWNILVNDHRFVSRSVAASGGAF